MRKITHKTVKIPVVKAIYCNMCAKKAGPFHDHLSIDKEFGYFSDRFGDGSKIEFDLCEECVYNLVQKFKIPSRITLKTPI